MREPPVEHRNHRKQHQKLTPFHADIERKKQRRQILIRLELWDVLALPLPGFQNAEWGLGSSPFDIALTAFERQIAISAPSPFLFPNEELAGHQKPFEGL